MKLNELLPFSEHESVDIDYKLHLDKNNPKSWAKSIVAFSNGEGGCLAIGADNDGNVVGVSAGEVDESKNLVYRIVDRMVRPGIVPLKFEPTKVGEDRFLLLLRIGKAHQMMFFEGRGLFRNGLRSKRRGIRSCFAEGTQVDVLRKKKLFL